MRIALDAMGGDRAPRIPVEGAVRAAKEFPCEIVLVGDKRKIDKFLAKQEYPKHKIFVEHTPEVIKMDDPAALSVRRKPRSSIVVGMNLLKAGDADIFISAGNTGAVVCAATLRLRLLPGVERAGIGIVYPTLISPCMMIDVGANIGAKPLHLLQYGIMGAAYSVHVLKKASPTIGLLNIGEEETKGTEFIKETRDLFKKSHLNFAGNAEARDVYSGKVDVVVCDGFIGNIVLKVTEGFAEASGVFLKREITKRLLPKIGAILSLPAYRAIRKKIDYTEYGGAPLLGVDGRVIIAHGASNAKAIKNAIGVAMDYVEHKVNAHIVEELQKLKGVI